MTALNLDSPRVRVHPGRMNSQIWITIKVARPCQQRLKLKGHRAREATRKRLLPGDQQTNTATGQRSGLRIRGVWTQGQEAPPSTITRQ
ncbi:uncharacterized protein V6R79_020247 [Siganus canaliculatus]